MITCAKGLTSGYSPLGAMIASDRLFEPFNDGKTMFPHGYTFGGHPVSAAVGLANLDIFEREGLNDRVKQHAPALRATLEKLYDLPIVGDVRGEGYFYGVELVKDQATKQTFDRRGTEIAAQPRVLGLFEAGLYCRTDDRGDSVIQLAPPLISGQAEFDTIEAILRSVLTEEWGRCEQAGDELAGSHRGGRAMRRSGFMTKPRIDPIRWQPPPSRPLPEPDLTATLHVVALPGNAPEDVVADADGNIWTGVEDGRIIRITPGRQLRAGGRRHRRATAGPGSRARRPSADLRQPPRPAAVRPGHRDNGNVGRGGGRSSADVLLQCRRIISGTIFFTESTRPVPLRVLQGLGDRGPRRRVAVPAGSGRNGQRAGVGSALRQRRDADRR